MKASLNRAVWYKRFLANLIDVLLISYVFHIPFLWNIFKDIISVGSVSAVVGFVNTYTDVLNHYLAHLNQGKVLDISEQTNEIIGGLIVLLILTLQEVFFKKTVGKWLFGLEIISPTTNIRASLHALVLRQYAKLIPFNSLSCISLNPRGWHEKITNTAIVETESVIPKIVRWFKAQQIGDKVAKIKLSSNESAVKNANVESLEKLFELKNKGGITEEEYIILKKNLLKSNLPKTIKE